MSKTGVSVYEIVTWEEFVIRKCWHQWHQWWYRTLFWSETLRVLGIIGSDWDRLLQKPTFVGQVPIAAQSVPIPIPFFPWWNITFLKSLRPLTGSHQSLKVHWGLPWSATREVGSNWCDYADVTIIHQSCCCADGADAPAGQDTWKELLERNRLETDKMVAVSFKDISRIFLHTIRAHRILLLKVLSPWGHIVTMIH